MVLFYFFALSFKLKKKIEVRCASQTSRVEMDLSKFKSDDFHGYISSKL